MRKKCKNLTQKSKGYIAYFENIQAAKSAASKLRNQGMKNVGFFFRDGQYCVNVSFK